MAATKSPTEQGLHWYQQQLPVDRASWPTDGQAEAVSSYIEATPWTWRGRRLFFFSDLHADTDAFLLSLIASGGIVKTGSEDIDFELTQEGRGAFFIIGGDCFDKGPHNLRLLEVINALYLKGGQVELLAGNHDVRTFIGIRHAEAQEPLLAHLFARMGKKTVPFLKEIHDGFIGDTGDDANEPISRLDELLFPGDDWWESFPPLVEDVMSAKKLSKEMKRIEEKSKEFRDRAEKLGLDLQQVYSAVVKFRELFFEPGGRYHWFFDNMKLAHREGSYLFVHGGVDDTVATLIGEHGVDCLNDEFRRLLDDDPFGLYHGELGNVMRTKYRDTDYPFTKAGAKALHGVGIHAIVHGHRSILEGQRVVVREGMLNFECDATIDRNTRRESGLSGLGGAAVVFTEDGEINGISTDYPFIKALSPKTEIVEGES
jgi:hypothetical protein